MSGYTKLFARILDSTVWRESDPTRLLWITMLALADKEGNVYCTIPGLADRARITLIECEKALEKFQLPDKYSWSQEDEGRRIRPITGGWFLINHEKFRNMMSREQKREVTRVRVSKWRESKKSVTVTKSNACNDIASTEASTTAKAINTPPTPPLENSEQIPEDLHPWNYAQKIIQDFAIPKTNYNIQVVTASVEAEMSAGKTGAAAYEFIVAGINDARDDGYAIDAFLFQNSRYRIENRRQVNGNGKKSFAQLRDEHNNEVIARAQAKAEAADRERSNFQSHSPRRGD